MKRFRGGLVFQAHRLLYHSTLGLRVIKKTEKSGCLTISTFITGAVHENGVAKKGAPEIGGKGVHAHRASRPGYEPLFTASERRGRFESLILSHHSRFTCECNKEEINDDDDDEEETT